MPQLLSTMTPDARVHLAQLIAIEAAQSAAAVILAQLVERA